MTITDAWIEHLKIVIFLKYFEGIHQFRRAFFHKCGMRNAEIRHLSRKMRMKNVKGKAECEHQITFFVNNAERGTTLKSIFVTFS